MAYDDIRFETTEGVARITIARPQVYNAFRSKTLQELADAYERVRKDSSVGVVVLTGEGEKAFCAGGDVNEEANGWLEGRGGELESRMLYEAMQRSLKPTIARVNGYAVGGGNHLAYMCDFTVAAEHAIFGHNGPRVGSPAQGWIVAYLVRAIGAKRAREMWMLCRRYTAAQMLDWGLVNAVTPLDQLDAEVAVWCKDLLALSPTVLKVIKRTFDGEWEQLRTFLETKDYLEEINPQFFESGEQTEGANAFLEKRQPDFSQWR